MSYIIEDSQIYEKTDNGKQIFIDYGENVVANKNFSDRDDDENPSASIFQHRTSKLWMFHDFGTGVNEDAIHYVMRKSGLGDYEARRVLAEKYGVPCLVNASINKAKYDCRSASSTDASFSYHAKDKFTDKELKVMGPNVKQEHCDLLGWKSLESYSWISDGKLHTLTSTENYPIFMRVLPKDRPDTPQCHKVYQVLAPNKNNRYYYLPSKTKPENYINGLAELKEAYIRYNEKEKKKWDDRDVKESEERTAYISKKLPAAAICSGERDALCCLSMGLQPLWLNSETADLSKNDYATIMRYVGKLYNIPDIDETGMREGKKLALAYPDIETIWLPEELKTRVKDFRGKPRKDLQGWMELYPSKEDFNELVKRALPARFWSIDKKGNITGIDSLLLLYFLKLNDIYAYIDPYNEKNIYFIQKTGYKVKEMTPDGIHDFVMEWVDKNQYGRRFLNMIIKSNLFSEPKLKRMEKRILNFQNYTESSQKFFFSDYCVEVTADDINPIPLKNYSSDNCVWDIQIFNHSFKKLDDMFTVSMSPDEHGQPTFDIKINRIDSNFLAYLINSSRLHWRQELENSMSDKSEEEKKAYLSTHKFDIAGEGLSNTEIAEQKQCLINKLFALGYLFHQYKSPSRAWAVFSMDNKIGEEDQCNGRSGKSIFFKFIEKIMTCDTISGQDKDPKSNRHLYERVSPSTRLIVFDDCAKGMKLSDFYDVITGNMTVNEKNVKSYNIGFEDSPKIAFTTNFVPQNFDPSTMARLIPMVYSDYYHEATLENDYSESRSVMSDFNKDLFTRQYSESEWNADLNLVLQATSFYLNVMKKWPSYKILPPMENIFIRKYKQDIGANFEAWADVYFTDNHLNCEILRTMVFEDYNHSVGKKAELTPNGFFKKLNFYCSLHGWELNPKDTWRGKGKGHITKTVDGVTREYLFIRTPDAPF